MKLEFLIYNKPPERSDPNGKLETLVLDPISFLCRLLKIEKLN